MLASAWLHEYFAERIHSLRSPRFTHLGERVKVMDIRMDASLPCSTLGEVSLQVLCVRSDVQPHNGIACRSVPHTCIVLAVRVVKFLGVVSWLDTRSHVV